MITITNNEKIKKDISGNPLLDKIWVKKFTMENVTSPESKKTFVVELCPYGIMSDGTAIHNLNDSMKYYISDIEKFTIDYITSDDQNKQAIGAKILEAYNAMNEAITMVMPEKLPGWTAEYTQTIGS